MLLLMTQSFRLNKSITVDQIEQELSAPKTSEIDIFKDKVEENIVIPSTTQEGVGDISTTTSTINTTSSILETNTSSTSSTIF